MRAVIPAILLLVTSLLEAGEVITNREIVKLVKAGLTPETVGEKIRTSSVAFDTTTEGLLDLARNGVPDALIRMMIEEQSERGTTPVTPQTEVTAPPPMPTERAAATPITTPPAVTSKKRDRTYRFDDVTLRRVSGGPCSLDLRLSGETLKGFGCSKAEDFALRWADVRGVCYSYGARGIVVFSTIDASYRIETLVPIAARDIVEKVRKLTQLEPSECARQ